MLEETFTAEGSINISLTSTTDDQDFEGEQAFIVDLMLNEMNTTFNGAIDISPNSTMVLIQDNDGKLP